MHFHHVSALILNSGPVLFHGIFSLIEYYILARVMLMPLGHRKQWPIGARTIKLSYNFPHFISPQKEKGQANANHPLLIPPSPGGAGTKPTGRMVAVAVKLAREESGDVIGLRRMNSGSGQRAEDSLQVGLAVKYNIGNIFCLHDAPVVFNWKMTNCSTVALCEPVRAFVECAQIKLIGQLLNLPVVDHREGVIQQGKANSFFAESSSHPSIAIEVDLQPEKTPCWHTNVAKPAYPSARCQIRRDR